MLLAVDLGNTNIVFGLFKGANLKKEWRFPSDKIIFPKIREKIGQIVVASVVPEMDMKLKKSLEKIYNCAPYFVTAQNIPGLKVRLKNKKEIGADRVVDGLAAYKLYGGPAIVVDFGTATTFDVIGAKGEYLGGAIAPGIVLARDALYKKTAKLPKVKIVAPKNIIGNNTVSAIQSGLVFGYVAMVEGMVGKIKSEIRNPKSETKPKFKISMSQIKTIATGGLAKVVCKYAKVIDKIDAELTLKGLQIIGEALHG